MRTELPRGLHGCRHRVLVLPSERRKCKCNRLFLHTKYDLFNMFAEGHMPLLLAIRMCSKTHLCLYGGADKCTVITLGANVSSTACNGNLFGGGNCTLACPPGYAGSGNPTLSCPLYGGNVPANGFSCTKSMRWCGPSANSTVLGTLRGLVFVRPQGG